MHNEAYIRETYQWQDLLNIVKKLRAPDGCPWDREQTYDSMKKCVMDECNEVVEAVDNKDIINLREELGDMMLQVLMYSTIAEELEDFTLEDVIDELAKKLIRRHPHVFGEQEAATDAADGLSRWQAIKRQEKQEKFKEYEQGYELGKISKELLELQRKKLILK